MRKKREAIAALLAHNRPVEFLAGEARAMIEHDATLFCVKNPDNTPAPIRDEYLDKAARGNWYVQDYLRLSRSQSALRLKSYRSTFAALYALGHFFQRTQGGYRG